jgi:hypothetical protein
LNCLPELEPEPKLRIAAPALFYEGKTCINPNKKNAGTQFEKVPNCQGVLQYYPELEPQFGFAATQSRSQKEIFSALQHWLILLYFHGKKFCRIRNQRQILRFFYTHIEYL